MDKSLWQGMFLFHSPTLVKRRAHREARSAIQRRENALLHFEQLARQAVALTRRSSDQAIPEWPSRESMAERWLEKLYESGLATLGTLAGLGAVAVASLPGSVFGVSEEYLRKLAAGPIRPERSRRLTQLADEFQAATRQCPGLEHIAIRPAANLDSWPVLPGESGNYIGFSDAIFHAVIGENARQSLGQHVASECWLRFSLARMELDLDSGAAEANPKSSGGRKDAATKPRRKKGRPGRTPTPIELDRQVLEDFAASNLSGAAFAASRDKSPCWLSKVKSRVRAKDDGLKESKRRTK